MHLIRSSPRYVAWKDRKRLAREGLFRGATLLAILFGFAAAPAVANGPCGNDYDGAHACPVSSPYSTAGSVTTVNGTDWYVFHAEPGTGLHVTLSYTGPYCGGDSYGDVYVQLVDSSGEILDGPYSAYRDSGVDIQAHIDYTLDGGTYYLQLGVDTGGCGGPPYGYQLGVSANPNVVWPYNPPPPPSPPVSQCVVPHFKRGAKLSVIKGRIVANQCSVGKIVRRHHPGVRHGRVYKLAPAPGHVFAAWRRVAIFVAR